MKTKLALAGMMLATAASAAFATAAEAAFPVREFTEGHRDGAGSTTYSNYIKNTAKLDGDTLIQGTVRANFKRYSDRVRVPGFISASALPEVAQVIGPANSGPNLRLGDTIYLRWAGAPGAHEGDRYHTFTPAIVMQSLIDATEFQVRLRPPSLKDIPADFRMAGYFYEATATVRILRVREGVVEAVIERLSGQLGIGDQLMPLIPVKERIAPITGGIELAAAVVSGSPADRLSTTERSFLYINRGSRDGIKEGRVFQAVETVKLDGPVNGPAPERSLGEAVVVHVTDSYSTAIITKQFEVIRIGALLKTKQDLNHIPSAAPFTDMMNTGKAPSKPTTGLPEIPEMGDLGSQQDATLPDPGKAAPAANSGLSELDQIEKGLGGGKLSAEERARLGRLSRQEKLDQPAEAEEEEAPAPAAPQNSFGKPKAKAKPKKKKKSNDEEELNLLMLEN